MSIESQFVDNALRTPTSSRSTFILPCGYLEEGEMGKTLYREVELKEMTGEEEDLLASRKIPFDKKMDALLAQCIVRFSTVDRVVEEATLEKDAVIEREEGPDITDRRKIRKIVPQLLLGDRTYLFFAIRRVSLGDEFPFKEECPQCEETSVQPFDLSTLKNRNMPTPKKRVYTKELPSGKSVEFRCMSGEEEKRRDRLKKQMKPLSLAIFLRLISIDGVEPSPFTVKALTMKDRDTLRAEFAGVDGGVETTIELTCPLCGHDFERELDPGQPSFFSPSETSAIWKRKSNT